MNENTTFFERHNKNSLFLLLLLMVTIFFGAICYAAAEEPYLISETEDSIIATLLENGYSMAGACGILGNISVENSEFDPNLEDNGITYGLFQWNDVDGRRNNLVKWCRNRCLDPSTKEGQIAFATYELEGGDALAAKVNDFLKTTDDAEDAAMEFAVGFERCVGSTGHEHQDGVYRGSFFPKMYGSTYQALNKRIRNACVYYDTYSDYELSSDLILKPKVIPTAGIVGEKEDVMHEKVEQVFPVKNNSPTKRQMLLSVVICLGVFIWKYSWNIDYFQSDKAKEYL